MKKTNIIFLIVLLFSTVFVSCQKKEDNEYNVLLTIDKTANNTETGNSTLSGRIIASGKVNMTDHGFDVVAGGTVYHFPLGNKKGPGVIETIVNSIPAGDTSTMEVTLYAYDDKGNYYSSKGNKSASNYITPTVELDSHYVDMVNYKEMFAGKIQNPGNYVVLGYGVQYDNGKGDSGLAPLSMNSSSNTLIFINDGVPFMTTFAPGYPYSWRFYIDVIDKTTGQPLQLYSTSDSFNATGI